MDEVLLVEIRSTTNGNSAFGSERFQKQIEVALGKRVARGTAGRPRKETATDERQKSLLRNTVVRPLFCLRRTPYQCMAVHVAAC